MFAATETIEDIVIEIGQKGRRAALEIAGASSSAKRSLLEDLAVQLKINSQRILDANQSDLQKALADGLSEAVFNRLKITESNISRMIERVGAIAAMEDPVGQLVEKCTRPNGLVLEKVTTPIGLIGIIYEALPRATIDCAALCIKSGNAVILKGGSAAYQTNKVLAGIVRDSLKARGLPQDAVQMIPTTDRKAVDCLIKLKQWVNCVIARGGSALIDHVARESLVPVIKQDKGVCNIFLDSSADLDQAMQIILNAKTQHPERGNSVENLFIHQSIINEALPMIAQALHNEGVSLKVDGVCEAVLLTCGAAIPFDVAQDADFYAEFLDKRLAIKSVYSIEDAIKNVNQYGSAYSDVILTENESNAEAFLRRVDSAVVYWNASCRLTDGVEFGLGPEIGVSTDRLYARGPIGLQNLCNTKYIARGHGQLRT